MLRFAARPTLWLLAALSPLSACDNLASPDPMLPARDAAARATTPLTLDLGSKAELSGERLLSFDALGPDDRCPIGVECPQPGGVQARFTLHTSGHAVPLAVTLPGGHPGPLTLVRAPRVSADSLLFYLLQVTPYPVASYGPPVWRTPSQGHTTNSARPTATLFVEACPPDVAVCGPASEAEDT